MEDDIQLNSTVNEPPPLSDSSMEEDYDILADSEMTELDPNATHDEESITVELNNQEPEKNMQPFRETLSEFEMFAKAGVYNVNTCV